MTRASMKGVPLSLQKTTKTRESPETFVKKPKKPMKAIKKRVKRTTPRKPRAPRAPKTRCDGTLTESAYWSWIRSTLRRATRRWRPVYSTLNAARRENKSDNKRLRWEYACASCLEFFPAKQVSVDHIVPAGSLRSGDDLKGFVARLLCERENLQVLCSDCHTKKTSLERVNKESNEQ